MSLAKLVPNDPRVSTHTAVLNGQTYKYILSEPSGQPKATIFLIHGWPDMGFGWRNQVPLLTSLGLRVVVPDMMGYGGTDSPESISSYTFKRAADDIATLAAHLSAPQIMLGGHDWGGMIVYRIALWYPHLVTSLFSICTPYVPPSSTYYPLSQLTQTVLPNFTYQLQLASGVVEEEIHTPARIREFLKGMYGGKTVDGKAAFDVRKGVIFENLEGIGESKLMDEEEVDYYTQEYSRNGLRGPLNWYRTRELNYKDELALVEKGEEALQIRCPSLFVQATMDAALPPAMARGMDRWFVGEEGLRRGEVGAGHWCLWQVSGECNRLIGDFVGKQLKRGARKSSL